jgi:uncharacterized membrane protein YeaQ/YmgE (transglycosylase-associated protein family)
MGGHGIIATLIIGLIAGFLTGKIMKGAGYGVIGDIVIGILGAFLGSWLLGLLHLPNAGGWLYTILVAVFGAIILTFLYRLITGNRS